MQRQRIWILTRHYPPDVGALAFRLEHLAQVLSSTYDVTVLASQPNRYTNAPKAPRLEQAGSIAIRRISSLQILKSRGKVGRLLTELLGALSMSLVALRHLRKIDVVVASTPPFFYSLPGWTMKRIGRRALVLDVRDLWLDWAEETGLVRSRIARKLLRRLERSAVGAADHITVTTDGFQRTLVERYGLDPNRVTTVFNGLDDDLLPEVITPVQSRHEGDPVHVLYAGNLGSSQNLLALTAGMTAALDKWPRLTLTLVGDGTERSALTAVNHERLRVLPHAARERLASLYADADAFLLHLADLDVYRHTVPSKVFEYAAFERPILCGVRGEAKEIAFRHADCFSFTPNDPNSLANALARLCSGEPPDNDKTVRADRSEILRSSRTEVWLTVMTKAM